MTHPSLTRSPEADDNPADTSASTHGEFFTYENVNTSDSLKNW
ncbi:hypothetical protein SynWH8103_02508 [Synechococcus sp. WH 8103]|nr:hypothetical protein SynWH8103_02508 [Synechococcus sp. WH 8103]